LVTDGLRATLTYTKMSSKIGFIFLTKSYSVEYRSTHTF
jgi:hypothetical protein